MDVVVVGGGLAGLAAALHLEAAGHQVALLEASDGPGGRVRTDVVDGFQLDRGFQILLTAYPELMRLFPGDTVDDLQLRRFGPGAYVQVGAQRYRVADPRRRPGALLDTVRAPVGSLADKARLATFVLDVCRGRAADLLARPDGSTLELLVERGFSARMVERLWRPLAGGIELDPTLGVSRRRFEIVLRMLAVGDAAVPARGMGRLPQLLAERLAPDTLRLGRPVDHLEATTAVVADGTRVVGRAVVVATDAPVAAAKSAQSRPSSSIGEAIPPAPS